MPDPVNVPTAREMIRISQSIYKKKYISYTQTNKSAKNPFKSRCFSEWQNNSPTKS